MANPFNMSAHHPIRVTATGRQTLQDALDVSAFDSADVLMWLEQVDGGGSVTVELITGMQKEREDGWVSLGSFGALSMASTPRGVKLQVTGLLKYMRWNVSAIGAPATFAIFSLSGMLRNN